MKNKTIPVVVMCKKFRTTLFDTVRHGLNHNSTRLNEYEDRYKMFC